MNKLTEENILEIGRNYGKSETGKSLAIKFGVSRQRIDQVANRLRKLGVNIPLIRISNNSIIKIAEQLRNEQNIKSP